MTTLVGIPPGAFVLSVDQLHRLTVAEYDRMIAAGILREGDPIELLEGLLVRKMTRNPPHDTALGLLEDALGTRLPRGWLRRTQCAVTTPDSVPEPDIAVVRGNARTYTTVHPGPADVGLVVEVSDSSLAQDRGQKLRIYAAAGIVLYWIVNVPDARVEVYTQPTGTGDQATYAQVQHFGPAADLVLILGGVALAPIRVSDILP
jgi:Uma2 family endonuclease